MTARFALFLSRIPTPRRYGRIMALLLASLGGAVDVFSHIHYKALVATQTGNFILLIADMSHSSQHAIHLRWLSVIFFSLGYLGGHLLHDLLGQRAHLKHWRIFTLVPFLLVCFVTPLIHRVSEHGVQVGALAFTIGLLIHALADTRIGENPFSLFMTSGNWRKMLSAWYEAGALYTRAAANTCSARRERAAGKRVKVRHPSADTDPSPVLAEDEGRRRRALMKALDYSLVVWGFVAGVLVMALLDQLVGSISLWFVGCLAAGAFWVGFRAEKNEDADNEAAAQGSAQ
ncbi:YoaK family protein [uncultured Rothia sp.]|uniref:YoaK family protein n=1 Tax=uncultured Rothia sp. TaxID=316088 RepID=UPI0025D2812C|nr:YoaK family protein [uncultured Rothia sp.]